MKVYVLGYDINIVAVFATRESAIAYVTQDYPEALFDNNDYWNGYWVESWDVI